MLRKTSVLSFILLFVCISVFMLSCNQEPVNTVTKTPTIRGSVSIPNGSGLTGSDFYVRIMEGEKAVYTGKASSDGSFSVSGLKEKTEYSILLTTEQPGDVQSSSRAVSRATGTSGYGGWLTNVTAAISEQADIGIVKVKPLGTIKGIAKRSEENDHSDIMVYIPGTSYMAMTDSEGNFSMFNVPQSTTAYSLRCISLSGDWRPEVKTGVLLYSESETENPVKTVETITIIKNAGNLVGTISKTAAADNSNITVLIENDDVSETGTTATDGSLKITGILPGTYKVTISSSGFVTQTIENVVIRAAKDTSIGEIVLVTNGGNIIGSVSVNDGSSLTGALITATSTNGNYSYTTSSDTDGTFVITNAYPTTYKLVVTKTGYAEAIKEGVRVTAGNPTAVGSIELSSSYGSISGRVLDTDGNPLSGASVVIGNLDAVITKTDGTFVKERIPVGEYTLSITKDGYVDGTVENIIVKSFYTTQLTKDVVLVPKTGTITGKIKLEGETDYSGIKVTVTSSGTGRQYSSYTESDGSFSISAVAGNYNEVEFSHSCCYARYNLENLALFASGSVEIKPKGSTSTEYQLTISHDFGILYSESKSSTCTENGYNTLRCWKCGKETVEYLDLLDHDKVLTDHHDASCTEDGWSEYKCSMCEQIFREIDECKGHDWGKPEIISAATCHDEGSHRVTCNTCGTEEIRPIEKLPHTWQDNGFNDGKIEYVCSICGDVEYAEDSTAILNISDWGSVSLKPSVDPESVKTLIIPSEIDGKTVTSVFEHTFQDCVNITKIVLPETLTSIESWAFAGCSGVTEIELPASLERIGDQAFRGCTSLKSIVIPDGIEKIEYATFYNCESLVSVTLPDSVTYLDRECFVGCGFDRFYIPEKVETLSCYVFMNCKNLKEILIPKSVKYVDDRPFWDCTALSTIYVASSTQPSGWITSWHDCCDAKIVWGYTGELHYKHTESEEWKTSSTYHWHECTECGETMSMAKHEFTSKVTKEPSCTEAGEMTYTCSVCGWEYTGVIKALGHEYESEVTKQATCTEKGEETFTCKHCGDSYIEEIVSHHEYKEEITSPASCTVDGLKTLTCTVCSDTKTEVIPATGHSYKDTIVPATCTVKGTTIHKCENCGNTYEEEIEALGHNHVASITKQANCEEDGIRTYVCSRCSDSYTETIPAYGHYFISSTIVQPATCFEAGLKSSKCFRCEKTVAEEIPKLEHDSVLAVDEANHWTECSLCGEILVAKNAHVFVESEGDYVCDDCGYSESSLYYQVDDNGVLTPKDKSILPSVVRIPSNINGKAVTSIGNDAFRDCTNIETLIISEGIKKVGENAFWYCTNITSLSLPSTLTEVGESAFRALEKLKELTIPGGLKYLPLQSFSLCHDLKSVVIEEGVERIGPYALEEIHNNKLEYVSIPRSVTTIEDYAFRQCYINEIHYAGTVSEWNSINKGLNWRSLSTFEKVICFDGVEELGNYEIDSNGNFSVIDKSKIGSVFEVPAIVDGKDVKGIGSDCFSGCNDLEKVILPDTVTKLNWYCFSGCENLKSIENTQNITEVDYGVFYGCTALEGLYLPKATLWRDGCDYCTSMTSVTFSNLLNETPRFNGCTSLEEIVFLGTVSEWNKLPKTNRWVGDVPAQYVTCSDGTVDITTIYYITSKGVLYCYNVSSLPTVYEIPSTVNGISVKTLSYNLFDSTKNHFTSITVPEGVTKFEGAVFRNCNSLESITLPESMTSWDEEIFTYSNNLESIKIPDGITKIGTRTFADCYKLSDVTIPSSVKSFGGGAFWSCLALKDIIIPESVTEIGNEVFACSGLVSIDIPNSVKTLGDRAVGDCDSLKEVSLSGNISCIPDYCFNNCRNLETILFKGTVAKWNSLPKGEKWNGNVPATKVVCIDGEVNL